LLDDFRYEYKFLEYIKNEVAQIVAIACSPRIVWTISLKIDVGSPIEPMEDVACFEQVPLPEPHARVECEIRDWKIDLGRQLDYGGVQAHWYRILMKHADELDEEVKAFMNGIKEAVEVAGETDVKV